MNASRSCPAGGGHGTKLPSLHEAAATAALRLARETVFDVAAGTATLADLDAAFGLCETFGADLSDLLTGHSAGRAGD